MHEARENHEIAKKKHKTLRDNMELKENTPIRRADLLQKNLDSYDNRRAHVIALSERVRQLRNNSSLLEIPMLESEIIQIEKELKDLQKDHDAYQHIARIAEAEQIKSKAQSRSAISEEINRLLHHVWGGTVEIELDDQGKPDESGGLKVTDESHGSKEQLYTILRMVLLGEASNHQGTTMLLDDALVHADQGRLSRMKDVFRESIRKDSMQLLVFSCRGSDYIDIADKVFDLNYA